MLAKYYQPFQECTDESGLGSNGSGYGSGANGSGSSTVPCKKVQGGRHYEVFHLKIIFFTYTFWWTEVGNINKRHSFYL